jgi:hypothetical protein
MVDAAKTAERALHMKLEKAVNALLGSARMTIRTNRPWLTHSTVPNKKIERLAEIMNQLARPQRKRKT